MKTFFLAFAPALCCLLLAGCTIRVSPEIESIIAVENQTGKSLVVYSQQTNNSIVAEPGKTVSFRHGKGYVEFQPAPANGIRPIKYSIDVSKMEGFDPETDEGLFSSTYTYKFVLGKDWRLYCKIIDSSDTAKLGKEQPKGFPLRPSVEPPPSLLKQ